MAWTDFRKSVKANIRRFPSEITNFDQLASVLTNATNNMFIEFLENRMFLLGGT